MLGDGLLQRPGRSMSPHSTAVLATSIPPRLSRLDMMGAEIGEVYQRHCIASWKTPGLRVVSVNHHDEADVIRQLHPNIEVMTVPTHAGALYGRPFVWVTDALETLRAQGSEVVGIVNSDIFLSMTPEYLATLIDKARDGVVVANRTEVCHFGQVEGPAYRYGYDLYLFPRKMIDDVEMDGFALGVPWWDYFILLDALWSGYDIHLVQRPIARHLTHEQKWSVPLWEKTSDLVASRIERRLGRMRSRASGGGLEARRAGMAADMLGLLSHTLRFRSPEFFLSKDIRHNLGTLLGLSMVRLFEANARPI